MTFSNDQHLLRFEPLLLSEIDWPEVTVIDLTDAVTTGTTLTSATADFEDAGVQPGMIGILSVASVIEIISVDAAGQLTVSRPRANDDADALPPGDGSAQALTIRSFEAIRTVVSQHIQDRLLGASDELAAEQIVVNDQLKAAESLGVLSTVYRIAAEDESSSNPDNQRLKATYYSQQFKQKLNQLRVAFDLDGDGVADGFRDLGNIRYIRR